MLLKFQFRTPSFLHNHRQCSEVFKIDAPAECYYLNSVAVTTRYGIVLVFDCDWKTNIGKEAFLTFKAVHEGHIYTAILDQSKVTEKKMMWYAIRFIRLVQTGEYTQYLTK